MDRVCNILWPTWNGEMVCRGSYSTYTDLILYIRYSWYWISTVTPSCTVFINNYYLNHIFVLAEPMDIVCIFCSDVVPITETRMPEDVPKSHQYVFTIASYAVNLADEYLLAVVSMCAPLFALLTSSAWI